MKRAVPPPAVFRYLEHRDHARAFESGFVWLSSFEHIRTCDTGRADPNEAKIDFEVKRLSPDMPADERATIHQRLNPMMTGDLSGLTMEGLSFVKEYPDCYVLCTTERDEPKMRPRFGEHCIRILQPDLFFQLIARRLAQNMSLEFSAFARVRYDGRKLVDASPDVGHPAFANVPGNAFEREARMVWGPTQDHKVAPFLLEAPEVARLCSIV